MSRYETTRILAVAPPVVAFGNDEVTLDMTVKPTFADYELRLAAVAASELVTDFDADEPTQVERYPRSMSALACPDRVEGLACFCGECDPSEAEIDAARAADQGADDAYLERLDRAEADRG